MNQFIIQAYYHLINCIIRTSFLQHHSNLSQCHCFYFFVLNDGQEDEDKGFVANTQAFLQHRSAS
jgi:hypothetical protein